MYVVVTVSGFASIGDLLCFLPISINKVVVFVVVVIVIVTFLSESTKKEQNTPCQENRIEMVVKTFGNDEIHCGVYFIISK